MINLKKSIEDKLESSHIDSRVLLDRLRMISESSRSTLAYNNSKYAPFYYYLGCEIEPKSMVEFGFRLGLLSSCFLMGCKTVKDFLAFQESSDEHYSSRLGSSNIKDHYRGNLKTYVGKVFDKEWTDMLGSRKWDIIFINEEMGYDSHMAHLDLAWLNLSEDGMIVMDYVDSHENAKEAYFNFCKVVNREPVTINTRYGVGLVQK